MKIRLNGEFRDIPEGTTVAALLRLLEVPEHRVAVERNRLVVGRGRFEAERLSEGDCLEVVRFVGGG
jgi:sulfur carrier protein